MTGIPGMKLADLARELKMASAELTAQLKDLGIAVSGVASQIDIDTANAVRELNGKPPVIPKVAEVIFV